MDFFDIGIDDFEETTEEEIFFCDHCGLEILGQDDIGQIISQSHLRSEVVGVSGGPFEVIEDPPEIICRNCWEEIENMRLDNFVMRLEALFLKAIRRKQRDKEGF